MKKIKEIYIITLLLLIIGITTSLATAGTVNANVVRVRDAASTSGKVLVNLNSGAKVDIEGKTGDWYKIKYNNTEGYIYADYVQADGTVTDLNTAAAPDQTADDTVAAETYPYTLIKTVSTNMYIIPSVTSSITQEIAAGETITINSKIGNWFYITYNKKTGWIRTFVDNTTKEAADTTASNTTAADTAAASTTPAATPSITGGYVNVPSAYMRDAPSTSGKIVTSLLQNAGVKITGEVSGWYAVQFQSYTGYMDKSLISSSPVTTSRSSDGPRAASLVSITSVQTSETEQAASEESAAGTSSLGIVDTAMKYLGYKYVYGGTTPQGGFDCSGFVQYVFKCCGYSLNRTAAGQASNGTAVSRANLQPGDIILFDNGSGKSIDHVGIYIGGGNMINAANPRKGVVITTINSGYYNTYYCCARRII